MLSCRCSLSSTASRTAKRRSRRSPDESSATEWLWRHTSTLTSIIGESFNLLRHFISPLFCLLQKRLFVLKRGSLTQTAFVRSVLDISKYRSNNTKCGNLDYFQNLLRSDQIFHSANSIGIPTLLSWLHSESCMYSCVELPLLGPKGTFCCISMIGTLNRQIFLVNLCGLGMFSAIMKITPYKNGCAMLITFA